MKLYKNNSTSHISAKLTVSEYVICARTVTATGYVSTSDRTIKDNIEDVSIDDCMKIFKHANVKTYERKDISGQRVGFIAQDIQSNMPPEFGNLLSMYYENKIPLSLDYSRMVCVLLGVCKQLQAQIDALQTPNSRKI